MNFAQTNLKLKSTVACLIAATLVSSSSGCGKSSAVKAAEEKAAKITAQLEDAERKAAEQEAVKLDNARQKFKEAVAAILVRTKGATCEEFRQSRLNLETSFQSNKSYLTNIYSEFSLLSKTMSATEYIWIRNIKLQAELPLLPLSEMGMFNEEYDAIFIIVPSLKNKLSYKTEQRRKDPDFDRENFVPRGLSRIEVLCDSIISDLNKPK